MSTSAHEEAGLFLTVDNYLVGLVGRSGSGKTVTGNFLVKSVWFQRIPTVTTRPPRERDRPGEYICVTPSEFEALSDEGAFLWEKSIHGMVYATEHRAVLAALECGAEKNISSVLYLTPQCIPILQAFCQKEGYAPPTILYLTAKESLLRERLKKRGEQEQDIRQRLLESEAWDTDIANLCDVNVIPNEGKSLDSLWGKVLGVFKRRGIFCLANYAKHIPQENHE